MRIKTICSLQTRKAMPCAVYETAPTSLEWKLQLAVRLTREKTWYAAPDWTYRFHVGKAIRDIWLVYIGLRTKIYSAAFQCVNLSKPQRNSLRFRGPWPASASLGDTEDRISVIMMFSWVVDCIINQLLGEVFVISRIIKVEVRVISRSRKEWKSSMYNQ